MHFLESLSKDVHLHLVVNGAWRLTEIYDNYSLPLKSCYPADLFLVLAIEIAMENSGSQVQSSKIKAMHQCKVVMLGDQAVGKSSIINRYIKNEFDKTHNV